MSVLSYGGARGRSGKQPNREPKYRHYPTTPYTRNSSASMLSHSFTISTAKRRPAMSSPSEHPGRLLRSVPRPHSVWPEKSLRTTRTSPVVPCRSAAIAPRHGHRWHPGRSEGVGGPIPYLPALRGGMNQSVAMSGNIVVGTSGALHQAFTYDVTKRDVMWAILAGPWGSWPRGRRLRRRSQGGNSAGRLQRDFRRRSSATLAMMIASGVRSACSIGWAYRRIRRMRHWRTARVVDRLQAAHHGGALGTPLA